MKTNEPDPTNFMPRINRGTPGRHAAGYRGKETERELGCPEVEGLLGGDVFVFPKVRGMPVALYWDVNIRDFDGSLGVEPKTRLSFWDLLLHLSTSNSCAGLRECLKDSTDSILYGVWMDYQEGEDYRHDVHGKILITDIYSRTHDCYLNFHDWEQVANAWGFDYVPPIDVFTDPIPEQIQRSLEYSTFGLRQGAAPMDLVLKNFEWRSQSGSQPWALVKQPQDD